MGGTDLSEPEPIKAPTQPISNSNNQDLLDLLGGLDTSPSLTTSDSGIGFITENNNQTIPFTMNHNSNILSGDFLNTNIISGKYVCDLCESFSF